MRLYDDYDRQAAVRYAHTWAYRRNPSYYDYEEIGGDCTNFASQCILAGNSLMNYEHTFGWYYIDANRKAPAWTGVEFLYRFLTRQKQTVGPVAELCELWQLKQGDIVQLSFDGTDYKHTAVVVSIGLPATPQNVLLAAHSFDTDYRPLSTYVYQQARYLNIRGTMRS